MIGACVVVRGRCINEDGGEIEFNLIVLMYDYGTMFVHTCNAHAARDV